MSSNYLRPIYKTLLAPGIVFFRSRAEYASEQAKHPDWPVLGPAKYDQRIKRWLDPAALTSNRQTMRYPNAIDLDRDGRPIVTDGQLEMVPGYTQPIEVAASVNIVEAFAAGSKLIGEVPPPLRLLTADEELVPAPGGFGDPDLTGWVLRIKSEYQQFLLASDVGFSGADRAMLRDIWTKLQGPAVG